MPIIIRKNGMKFKDPETGNYISFDVAIDQAATEGVAAVNSAGTTQVSAVNSAGTTQVNAVNSAGSSYVSAIEAKGAEALESIPEDYTDLSDDVSAL